MTTEPHFDSLDDLFGGLDSELAQQAGRHPFKFLDPYGPEDRDIFFGRDLEIAETYAKFFKSPLLLVYGESGSGKTSLLQCGLRTAIPTEDAAFYTVRSAIDPLASLRRELCRDFDFGDAAPPEALSELLQKVTFRRSKTVVLIFDQFEELFLLQSEPVRRQLIAEMAAWIEAGLNLRIVIAIREEYYARLTELEAALPQLYDNRLWVRRMSRLQAEEVITGPCRACGVEIDAELVTELAGELASEGKGVELPILQVVLDTLYNQAVKRDATAIRLSLADYQALGRIQSILANFVEDRVQVFGPEAELARQVLKAMVTAEGTRRVSSLTEITARAAHFGPALAEETADAILGRLINERIVRQDADSHHYELRHDSLARTVQQWMTGIEQELMEVRQNLENRFKEYRHRGALLDQEALAYVGPYESRLNLGPELAAFVEKSRAEVARRRRRRLTVAFSLFSLVLLVVSGL
ncbi:MAG: AAA family ATPase, partial [Elusimicrobiota bacterium]